MKDVNALCVCVIITRVMLECRCPDIRLEQDSSASYFKDAVLIQKRLLQDVFYCSQYTSAVVFVARRRVFFGLFQFEAFIHHHHHVPVTGGFNSHHDSVKPLCHSPLLDRLKRHLELASSRSAGYLSFKLIFYPNSDSTSQLTRLTTSGDSSLNPGPERCSVCGNSVARNHRSPSCDSCELQCHIKCGLITPREFKRF